MKKKGNIGGNKDKASTSKSADPKTPKKRMKKAQGATNQPSLPTSCLKSSLNHLKGSSSLNYATAATSKASPFQVKEIVPKSRKGDFVPVCMALGMIGLSTSFGIHAAMQQLRRAPNVHVKKTRRETLPEIVEPEHVAEEAEKFVNKSLFRKVAHIQDIDSRRVIPDTRGSIYTKKPGVETLKTIGVDPKM